MNIFKINKKDIQPHNFESHIIGSDNHIRRVLAGAESHREFVPYAKIPKYLIDAIVTTEDQRFFQHHGVDRKGLIRSIIIDIITLGKKVQGGSTITQQLIKNTCFPNWYSNHSIKNKLKRKIWELFIAFRIERFTSKEEILENYLNVIYFGNGCYGVQTAAKLYFNKNVWELDLAECAIFAGIPLSPSTYNPFANEKKCIGRRNLILRKMYQQQKISKSEYIAAKSEELHLASKDSKQHILGGADIYSYYEDALIEQIVANIMKKKHITHDEAMNMIFCGGLRIYTTENQKIQRFSEKIYNDPKYIPDLGAPDGPESAMILMDSNTGHVIATIGGRGHKEGSLVFSRAYKARRNHNLDTFSDYFIRTEYRPSEKGINILDVVLAYSNYESRGKTKNAFFYKRVLDYKKRSVLSDKEIYYDSLDEKKSYSKPIHDIHESLASPMEINFPRDIWVVGRVGNLILGVWGGYDDNRQIPLQEKYFTFPRKIWKEIAGYIEKENLYEDY